MNDVVCSICGTHFGINKSLYTHLRRKHQIEPLPILPKTFKCNKCDKAFTWKSSLRRHNRQTHKTKNSLAARLLCPFECDKRCHNYVKLHEHLTEKHGIDLEYGELMFSSKADFEQWKETLEQETLSLYTQDSATKRLKNGVVKIFYNCHRSYGYKKEGKDIPPIKSFGRNQTGKACPSRLKVEITPQNGETVVYVKYWAKHCGHSKGIERMPIRRDTKLKLGKLKKRVTFDEIIDSIRNCEENYAKKESLLNRKHLQNDVRDINVNLNTKHYKQDGYSVKEWVKEMEKLDEDSPVLYYNGHDLSAEDFVLILMMEFQAQKLSQCTNIQICIDGTPGINGNDLKLYTILNVDEFGAACPVAYCFANRSDETLFTLYFNVVKTKVGIIIAEIFMSNDASAFYNAWAGVMGQVSHKLLCSWYVDNNWRKNLKKIQGNSEKKDLVYKSLTYLLRLNDVDEFEVSLKEISQDLLDYNDTKEFGEYFQHYYYHRPQSWAHCYRPMFGVNKNTGLESLHKVLKCIYLEGKKVKSLHKSINSVLILTRDTIFKNLIKLSKKSPAEKFKEIKQSHIDSQNIKAEDIKIIEEQREWVLTSSSNQEYQIVKAQEACDVPCWTCTECNICIHSFKCSCIDNVIMMNICKHIHACATEFFAYPTFESDIDEIEILGLMEMDGLD